MVRDLGIHIDAESPTFLWDPTSWRPRLPVLQFYVSFRVSATRYLPRTAFQSLVSCLVLPRLDYCNAVLAGIPLHLARRLQSVMNAGARLVFASSKCDHITPLLRQLHWLKVQPRTDHKLAVLVYRNVFMAWHRYTSPTNFTIQQSRSFEGVCVPLRLTNCLFLVPDSQPTATELYQSPLYGSGTVFRSISHLFRYFLSSALAWRHTSSNSVTHNCSCHAREVTLSFMDTLIAFTYLLTHKQTLDNNNTFATLSLHMW